MNIKLGERMCKNLKLIGFKKTIVYSEDTYQSIRKDK